MKQGGLTVEPAGDHRIVTTSPIGPGSEERETGGGVMISAKPVAYVLSQSRRVRLSGLDRLQRAPVNGGCASVFSPVK